MYPINLISLIAAKKDLSAQAFSNYLNVYEMSTRIRDHEYDDLKKLMESIYQLAPQDYIWNDFYFGYMIKQISKEFDVLKVTEEAILNIELKFDARESRIKKQLKQNEYYLKFLNKPMYFFTYVSKSNKLYEWKNGKLQLCDKQLLLNVLKQLAKKPALVLDDLFDPAIYLASPIETPEKFMNDEYFLTAQQTTYKKEIMDDINNSFQLLAGGAGTGKTLLAYDLAKTYMRLGKKVVIVQPEPLFQMQLKLNEHYPWTICSIDQIDTIAACDVCVIDEIHLLAPLQRRALQQFIEQFQPHVIMTADLTVIHREELELLNSYPNCNVYELKMVYRENESLVHFLMKLFDHQSTKKVIKTDMIEVQYFSELEDAYAYIRSIQHDYKIVNSAALDERSYYRQKDLLGVTLDSVAVLLDRRFYYNKNRLTIMEDAGSVAIHRLYQLLTKTRKRLKLIVVQNEPLLAEILKLKRG